MTQNVSYEPASASPVDCADFRERATDYIEQALPAAARGPYERHFEECAGCRALVEELEVTASTLRLLREDTSTETHERLLGLFRTWRRSTAGQTHADAPPPEQLFSELEEHSPWQRETLVRNLARYRSPELCEWLLERSWSLRHDQPQPMLELAALAVTVAESLDDRRLEVDRLSELRARAWGHLANSRRIKADLRGAEEALGRAEAYVRAGGVGAPVRALLLSFRGDLLAERRRFHQACEAHRLSAELYASLGDHRHEQLEISSGACSLMKACRFEQALEMLAELAAREDLVEDPWMVLLVGHNRALCLTELGRHHEALTRQRKLEPLYRELAGRIALLRRRWLEGKILKGLGEPAAAEKAFLEIREVFVAEGLTFDVALVSMDLAALYAEQGRLAEVRRLAGEALPIFQSLQIGTEAVAMLAMLQQAREAETAAVLVRQIDGIVSLLRATPRSPHLRLQQ